MLTLDQLVTIMTEPHEADMNRYTPDAAPRMAVEDSLLTQLEEAKTLRSGGGASASGGSAMPLKGDALVIEADIIRTIHRSVSVHDRYTAAGLPLPERVRFWANLAPADTVREHLTTWAEQIRELFQSYISLQAQCPACGERYVYQYTEGERTRLDAMRVNKTTLVAKCCVCASEWHGEQELRDMALQLA